MGPNPGERTKSGFKKAIESDVAEIFLKLCLAKLVTELMAEL